MARALMLIKHFLCPFVVRNISGLLKYDICAELITRLHFLRLGAGPSMTA